MFEMTLKTCVVCTVQYITFLRVHDYRGHRVQRLSTNASWVIPLGVMGGNGLSGDTGELGCTHCPQGTENHRYRNISTLESDKVHV